VSLSLLLLVGAGLFTRSLINLRKLDPGFKTANLIIFSADASRNGYDQPRVHQLYQDLQEKLASVPGATSAALADMVLLSGDSSSNTVHVQGYQPKPDENMNPNFMQISPGFFSTMGIPLVQGRDFNVKDKLGAPKVAVVNESFARKYFPNENPLGRRFGLGLSEGPLDTEIVGVVKDGRYDTLRKDNVRIVYVPYQQEPQLGFVCFHVRTAAKPEALMPSLRKQVAEIDPTLALWDLKTMESQVDESLLAERLVAILCACFGGLATILASIGLYGVMAFSVARRTREIGIRMALGAGQHRVLVMVLREVTLLCLIGIAVGVPLCIGLSRFLVSQLYGITPTDKLTIAGASLVMLLVSVLAGLLPARRASTVDPTIALRYE
jgi:predicted permease